MSKEMMTISPQWANMLKSGEKNIEFRTSKFDISSLITTDDSNWKELSSIVMTNEAEKNKLGGN